METGMSLKWKGWADQGRPGGDRGGWEDWKNTGGFTWKTWMDKVDTWVDKVDLDGQGGYLNEDYMNTLYGLLTLLMCQVGTS